MAESRLSPNQYYIKHMNDLLSANQYTIQVLTIFAITTTYK